MARRGKENMQSKKLCQRKHAQRRAFERYDFPFTRMQRKEIVSIIQRGEALFMRKCSNRVSEFIVSYGDKKMRVLYDRKRHEIITFLPPLSS